ncbi:MAG: ArsR/SmtB family transcription factor [Candidatus Izemoplasmatales bacterium]
MKIKLLNEIEKQKVSNLFKVIADPTRIDILYTLKDSRLSVSEIKDKLNMSQSAISHQLRVLKDVNLVKDERVGKNIFYSLSDNHVYDIFNQAIDHVREEECNHE